MSNPLYLVLCGQLEPYCVERNVPDMTWAGTVRDIADMQFNNLSKVIEISTGRDVTAIMVREAANLRVDRNDDNCHEFGVLVELTLGTRAARPFLRAA
jgi:hypothetical protein